MNEHPVTAQELARLHAAWELAPESRSFAPLADAYHRAGRHEEAIELLQSGTTRHPDYLSALVLLADCYQALQRTEEASAIYARVLSQDEENIRALEHQAAQSIQQGALGNAAALVEKLRQIDPWDSNIRKLSAQLQQTSAQLRPPTPAPPAVDATSDRRGGIPKPPPAPALHAGADVPPPSRILPAEESSSGQASDQLSTLTLAQIYESQGYLQKALTIYERLLQQHPGNAQVAQRLEELRRRLTGVDESAQRGDARFGGGAGAPPELHEPPQPQVPPAPEPPQRAPTASGWRLVDERSLGELRSADASSPWSAKGDAVPGNEPAANAAAARDEDFQRFLRYVRSLGT